MIQIKFLNIKILFSHHYLIIFILRMSFKNIFVICCIIAFSCEFNVQNIPMALNIIEKASQYLGRRSSDFPGATFLLNILYGHSDIPFTLQYLFQYLGPNTTKIDRGYILIGNDSKLAAIALDQYNFIVPYSRRNYQRSARLSDLFIFSLWISH